MRTGIHKEGMRAGTETMSVADALNLLGQLKDTVKQCANELSSANAVLRQQMTSPAPVDNAARALAQSEAVESKVIRCAEELATLNDALCDGIVEREALELELSNSQAAEKTARRIAYHDAITGLPNRTLFNDRLKHALAQAERHGWRVVIMFIDLDKFKNINDTHGHDVGDKVLHAIGRRLQESVRAGDTVSRRSGDEFLYLMLEAKDDSSIEHLALKIIDTIAAPIEVGKLSLTVGASLGVAVYPEDAQTAEALLKNADHAMYRAKKSKKSYLLFSSLTPTRWPPTLVGSIRSGY
jgi:diguanylate cyclase (GGDEF)-like protein